ncbi:MAG: hypothetical protein AAGD92_08530 [Pseudomonadota bacterium]
MAKRFNSERLRRLSQRSCAAATLIALVAAPGAFAQVQLPPAVESTALSRDAFSTGTLGPADGALPETLWRNAEVQTLEFLLENLPARPAAPSLGEAMRRTLLSPGTGPDGAGGALGGKKLLALARAGFLKEAATVASLSTANGNDPWTGQSEAVRALLSGDINAACRRSERLSSGRDNPFWVKLRVLCYAQAGERDAADLTLGILRDQYGLDAEEDAYLTAAATGAAPKAPAPIRSALLYAASRLLETPLAPGLLGEADGGVLAAIISDQSADLSARIAASETAAAMGVISGAELAAVLGGAEFDVAEIGAAVETARARSADPLTDALLYKSIETLSAPEFVRDKAQRIALALGLADSFHRAYALSVLYADELEALEGIIVSPEEAGVFASARLAIGDSVGGARWLSAMLGEGESVSALPETQAMMFIELVNLLAILDPQAASQVARRADVAVLGEDAPMPAGADDLEIDADLRAHILEAAFDAALENKIGQAALAALAASRQEAVDPAQRVIVSQSLKAAGLEDIERRYRFERAFSRRFARVDLASAADETGSAGADQNNGLTPRLKPTGER